MIISLNATFENLSRYDEVPAMKETLELPITIQVTLDLLQKAGLYMDGKGRGAVTDQTGQTVDNVIDLVGSFVNYTINFMKEVSAVNTKHTRNYTIPLWKVWDQGF